MTSRPGQLAIKDIAALAEVTRAAVSNWRSRNEDFPAPVEGSPARRPLFDLDEVMHWLKSKGLLPKNAQKKQVETNIWGLVNLLKGATSTPTDAGIFILYLLAVRKQSASNNADTTWAKITSASTNTDLINALSTASPLANVDIALVSTVVEKISHSLNETTLVEFVHSLDSIPFDNYGEAANIVLDRLLGLGGRGDISALSTSHSRQSTLLINAASTTITSGSAIFDPACGIGGTLLGLNSQHTGLTLIGNDIDATVLTIARLHAFLSDISATFTQSDSLTHAPYDPVRVETVVTEPPLGVRIDREIQQHILSNTGIEASGTLSSDELFLLVALDSLAPGGRAYVLTTPRAGFNKSSQQVRQELVARGFVEAVIQLPSKLLPYSHIETLLWVLHRPAGEPDTSVLIAHAPDSSSPEHDIAQWLTDMRQGHPTKIPTGKLSLAELITNEGVINPRALLREEPETAQVQQELQRSVTALSSTMTELHDVDLETNHLQRIPTSEGFTDLHHLITSDALTRIRKHTSLTRKTAAEETGEAFVLPLGERSQEPKKVSTSPTDVYVQNGDIIVPETMLQPARVFAADGSKWVAPAGMTVLRINDSRFDAHYLVSCINAPFNNVAGHGVGIQRRDFKQIQVPLLNEQQQQSASASLQTLAGLKTVAERLAQQIDAAEAAILNAVRFNNAAQ